MKELLIKVRQYLKLSQSEFAKKIGLQFATINRWENGHSIPTRLAQERLFEVCQEYSVPIYQMVIDNLNTKISSIKADEGRIILFHGSKSGIDGNISPISRDKCDFGKGFYMGTSIEQPLTLICDSIDSRLYVLSLDLKNLNVINIKLTIDWAMLVALHRGKMETIKSNYLYKKYQSMTNNIDIVIGSIADDRMFFVLDNFFLGNITDIALTKSLSALDLGRQYVAITQRACKQIKIEKEIQVSYFEKLVLKKASEANRKKGIDLANSICKSFRREGKYFDELINEANEEK